MATAILASGGSGGSGSDDCTAQQALVLAGYTAIVLGSDDEPTEGSIVTNSDSGTVTLTASTPSKTFPVGYYPNTHTVNVNVFTW